MEEILHHSGSPICCDIKVGVYEPMQDFLHPRPQPPLEKDDRGNVEGKNIALCTAPAL